MKKASFGSKLQQICSKSFRDGEISVLDSAVGYSLTEANKPVIHELNTLIFKTEYFTHDTKMYLQNEYATYRSVCQINGCADNAYTSRSRVRYDISKLKSEIGSDFFEVIIENPDISSIQRVLSKLQQLIASNQIKPLKDGFIFKVSESIAIVKELAELDYSLLQDIAFRYSRKGKAAAQSLVNTEMVGYMNY